MEPRPFARVSIASLALRLPEQDSTLHHAHSSSSASSTSSASSASSGLSALTSSTNSASSPSSAFNYFCEVRLSNFGSQFAPLPLSSALPKGEVEPHGSSIAASFYLDGPALTRLFSGSFFSRKPQIQVIVYLGSRLPTSSSLGSCLKAGLRELGRFALPVGAELASPKGSQSLHNGWVRIKGSKGSPQLHISVRAELDPRYIFEFDGEPELSPQIVQIQGNIRQPIFTCKFTRDRSFRSRGRQLGGDWAKEADIVDQRERKGWLVIIYDLSGAAVAAASMVTPFVPTAGSDRVNRSNPGAWLIMKAGPMADNDWRPWGKLEAWREKGALGCRFQIIPEGGGVAGVIGRTAASEAMINSSRGSIFSIDTTKLRAETPLSASPVDSPRSSGDLYFSTSSGAPSSGGFVMSVQVAGEGRSSRPHVEIAMRHVVSMDDAAVFMALAAAVDLSMDACTPFNRKLGKNFRPGAQIHV